MSRKVSVYCSIAIFSLLIVVSSPAHMDLDSNFNMGSYPMFNRPKPFQPSSVISEFTIEHYVQEVRKYREEGLNYLQKARNDMFIIQVAITHATTRINEVVTDYNSFIHSLHE